MTYIIARAKNNTVSTLSLGTFGDITTGDIQTIFYSFDFFSEANFKHQEPLIHTGELELYDVYGNLIPEDDAVCSYSDVLDFINQYPPVMFNGLSYAFNGTIARYIIGKVNQYMKDNGGDADNFDGVNGAYESMMIGLKDVSLDYWDNKITDTFFTTSFKDDVSDLINVGFK